MRTLRIIAKLTVLFFAVATMASAQETSEWEVLNQGIQNLNNKGKYEEATILAEKALVVARESDNETDFKVATSLGNLSWMHERQGHYELAGSLYQQELSAWEKVFGPEHINVSSVAHGLAEFYRLHGECRLAEPLYRQSLVIKEKVLGKNHVDVAVVLGNLAELHRMAGDYGLAEPLYKRSLSIYETLNGPADPSIGYTDTDISILSTRIKMAKLYTMAGKYDLAEFYYKKTLNTAYDFYGTESPASPGIQNGLATLYYKQGKYALAEPLYLKALAIWKKTIGLRDIGAAVILENLAQLYRKTDRAGKAEDLEKRTEQIRATNKIKNVLGHFMEENRCLVKMK